MDERRKYKHVSNEKRADIIRSLENGDMSRKDVAKSLNISYVAVAKIYSDFCKTGKTAKLKVGGQKPKKLSGDHINFLKELLINDCTQTLKILKEKILIKFGISVCEATISNYIDAFNFSIKRLSKVSISALTEVLSNERREYSKWFLELQNEGRNFLFFDETGFQITMRKGYGRSEKGKKAIAVTPTIKSRNKTVMAAMWNQGLLHYKALTNSGNRVSCLQYMEELVIILEKKNITNAVLIMDNVPFHKCSEIRTCIESSGNFVKFLPPYSPFFNPIEYMFSQWKSIVRAQNTTSDVELMAAIDGFKGIVTRENCENYVRHVTTNMIKCLSGCNVFEL